MADENKIKIDGRQAIPHDLWPAADLPAMSLVDRLSLPTARQIEVSDRDKRCAAGRAGHSDQSRSSATTACSIRRREAASGPRHS